MLWITRLYWSSRRTLLHYVWRQQALRCVTNLAAYVGFWPIADIGPAANVHLFFGDSVRAQFNLINCLPACRLRLRNDLGIWEATLESAPRRPRCRPDFPSGAMPVYNIPSNTQRIG